MAQMPQDLQLAQRPLRDGDVVEGTPLKGVQKKDEIRKKKRNRLKFHEIPLNSIKFNEIQ